jgi:hypothetical protein
MLTKTPGIIIDNDATGAFDRVIYGIVLLALCSIGFASSATIMLGLTCSKRNFISRQDLESRKDSINIWKKIRPLGLDKDYRICLKYHTT